MQVVRNPVVSGAVTASGLDIGSQYKNCKQSGGGWLSCTSNIDWNQSAIAGSVGAATSGWGAAMATGAGVKPWSPFSPIQTATPAAIVIKVKQTIMNNMVNKGAQAAYQHNKQKNNAPKTKTVK